MSRLQDRARQILPGAVGSAIRSVVPVIACFVLAAVLQFFVKPLIGDFVAKIMLDIGISVVLAVSLTMVNGFTGQFSIGHAAFMAVGGYTAAAIVYYGSMLAWGDASERGGLISTMLTGREVPLVTFGDVLFAGALIAGGLVAAVCGWLVGLPSLRLRGDYLAIVTLGFGEIVRVLIQSQTEDVLYTVEEIRATPFYLLPTKIGGALGFSGLPFYSNLFWVFLVAGLTLLVAFRLKESAVGRAFLSIREDEIASEAMGVNTTRFKVRAFVIAAFFAGAAGGLFAHTVGVQLNPGELGFQKSFDIIIMVVLGGMGSISGAAIAAAIVTVLPELLRNPAPLLVALPYAAVISGVAVVLEIGLRLRGRRMPVLSVVRTIAIVTLVLALAAKWAVSRGVDLGQYRMIFFALALILMMIGRPQGLFGVREIWERSLWRTMLEGLRPRPVREEAP